MKRKDSRITLYEASPDPEVEIPLLRVPVLDESGQPKPGEFTGVVANVRALSAVEETEARVFARKYAQEKGAKDEHGDPDFELAFHAAVVATAVYNGRRQGEDAPRKDAPKEPFFATPSEALEENVGVISKLFEHVELRQDEVSPFLHRVNNEQLVQMVRDSQMGSTGGASMRRFLALPPVTRALYTHTLAVTVASSPEAMSLFTRLMLGSPENSSAQSQTN